MGEAASSRKLGSTLKVPNVQDLVKQQVAVPLRYIRDDIETPILTSNSSSILPQVPVIDMEKLLAIGNDGSELQRLHFACKEWGFFRLVNHGVSSSLVEKVKSEVGAFFDLPLEEKKKFEHEEGDVEGYGQNFVFSEEQKLDWADIFYMTTLPTHLRKPHLFPKLPLSLREIMEAHCQEFKSLAISILCQLAKALKMDENEMKNLFSDGMQSIRMNYYPPCPEPDKTIGLSPHSDADALTILLQLNDTEGLQVRKDDIWVPIKPLPNALIVNVGDMMEIVSNGVYRSIEHRAVVNSNKERLSLATFNIFNLDAELGPAHSLIGPHNPAKFRSVRVENFLQEFFERKLDGKSFIDCMKLETKDDESWFIILSKTHVAFYELHFRLV